jgi:hypothetical protein
MYASKIVGHIRAKHENATTEQLELAAETMGLKAFQCGFLSQAGQHQRTPGTGRLSDTRRLRPGPRL